MAQRVQIILEDDYDGGTADETVSFALDGTEYEIDLSAKNAASPRDAISPPRAGRPASPDAGTRSGLLPPPRRPPARGVASRPGGGPPAKPAGGVSGER